MKAFKEAVQQLTPLTSTEASQAKQTTEEIVVFLGRATCPYCRRFLPKLIEAVEQTHQTVYFLDSTDQSDEVLQALRAEADAKTVPSLLRLGNGEVTNLQADSSLSVEEIVARIQ